MNSNCDNLEGGQYNIKGQPIMDEDALKSSLALKYSLEGLSSDQLKKKLGCDEFFGCDFDLIFDYERIEERRLEARGYNRKMQYVENKLKKILQAILGYSQAMC